ncbi:MAG: hypothetical protein H6823_24370 [Planctomycetaceae bacterium]|nr:hypothetical protein [Planctomycetales bacterium]MCB9941380.1 hypothetical protein [Planctomycetaceae bacterium]
MKLTRQHRRLVFEQLEAKSAPSSVLLVTLADATAPSDVEGAVEAVALQSFQATDYRYDSEQVLEFIAQNTADTPHSHRPGEPPTRAACEASDEMMRIVAAETSGLFALGFYDGGAEL